MMNKKIVVAALLISALMAQSVIGQSSSAMTAKIKKEAMENSQIMETLHYFTDVYGPRLTGSPKLENAGKWAMKRMKSWGI